MGTLLISKIREEYPGMLLFFTMQIACCCKQECWQFLGFDMPWHASLEASLDKVLVPVYTCCQIVSGFAQERQHAVSLHASTSEVHPCVLQSDMKRLLPVVYTS